MKEKKLLKQIRHIALATVNEDGTPHNTPLFFIYNEDFSQLYWGSHPESLHSKNIQRTGNGFAVVFDTKESGGGGLYLTLGNARQITEDELPKALQVHNKIRLRWGKKPLPLSYYQSSNAQRMYIADILKIEAYSAVRDENNLILQETRRKIRSEDLFA